MSVYDQIAAALKREYESGSTQQEIADRAGVTNPYINNLLSGKRKFESMKLETLFKLFPRAKLIVEPEALLDDTDSTILELLQDLSQKEKLNLIVSLSKMTATKRTSVAENQKIG